ncbi:hypothetical protein FB451DRAFT_1412606 [Mycena latifolia]|nr:hypothetical protein FB451DRAFT_1417591 [Mycena latifolia]KAJ7445932.1 hypothetical protein FB451DRAFT_1412606 [Mycena latifolia]
MACGRKRLSPKEKLEHRQASLTKYAEKNVDRLRDAGRLRTQRNRAALTDADDTTVSLLSLHHEPGEDSRLGLIAQSSSKKAEGPEVSEEVLSSTTVSKIQAPQRQSTAQSAPKQSSQSQSRMHANSYGGEEEEDSTHEARHSPAAFFPGRALFAERTLPPCPEGCDDAGCEGCACLCEASSHWIRHEHYRTDAWRAAGCP